MPDSNPHNVRSHLRLGDDSYDEAIRRFIPGYDAMLNSAAQAVLSCGPSCIVDLGAGSGSLSEAILDRSESTVIELLDIDPEMLAIAQARLERFGNRATYSHQSFYTPFGESDAFAASLSLHHIRTLEEKALLFANVYSALRPGGVFVIADINMPEDEEKRVSLYRHWASFMASNGISETRAFQYFEEWAEEDSYLPIDAELNALQKIGFQVRCEYSNGPANVVVARKH